jgi:ribonucleases P/MRP protein subunit RPP40
VRDKSIILQLYKSLVRPHLEYSIQAWRSHFRKDVILLEGVQKGATKLMTAIEDKVYEDRLRYVNLQLWKRGDKEVIQLKFLRYLKG